MNNTRWIDKDVADSLRFEGDYEDGYEVVKVIDHDHSRWESHHTLVLQDMNDDTFWMSGFSKGLTEYQHSEGFWNVSDGKVQFRRANQERVHTYVYHEVDDD